MKVLRLEWHIRQLRVPGQNWLDCGTVFALHKCPNLANVKMAKSFVKVHLQS